MNESRLPDLLRYRDRDTWGLTRYRLDRMVADGEYERIAPGTFLRVDSLDDTTAAWMAIAAKRSTATLCLLSALSLHELTDEIPRASEIAIPRGTHPVTVHYAPVSWHRFAPGTFSIGRTEHALPGGMSIGLYSPERTLIDVFRLRHAWGSDLAIEALKRWLRAREVPVTKLMTMAQNFPEAQPALRNALEVLL